MLLSDHAVTTAQFSDGPHTQTEPPVPFTFMTSKATNWHTRIIGRGGEGRVLRTLAFLAVMGTTVLYIVGWVVVVKQAHAGIIN